MIRMPLNLPKWLEENSHLLKPPINNYCVYNDDMTVMIVGGPNARSDYHVNPTPEFFYQYRGSMLLRIVDVSGEPNSEALAASMLPGADSPPPPPVAAFRDVPIREGELFLLPPNTPHNPIRFADTVGVVLEQPRPADSLDQLRWYCSDPACRGLVHRAAFHCTNLGTQIAEVVNAFAADESLRRCPACGRMCDTVPAGVVQP